MAQDELSVQLANNKKNANLSAIKGKSKESGKNAIVLMDVINTEILRLK